MSTLHLLASNGDPLYFAGLNWAVLLIVLIKVVISFAVCMGAVTMMIWFERKAISDMQSRIGPDRAGPWGILQSLADGIKLFFKEDLIPEQADSFVFKLAPYLSVVPALIVFTVVPVGGVVTVAGHTFELQIADPPIGILLVLAMSAIGVYGILLAGWSSGSKYPLMSAVRSSAQMISYEAALGMTVVTVVLITGSLSTRTIVDAQSGAPWHWNVIRLGVVPFVLFLIAGIAETNRPPFDVVEAESELVGGFNTEYSSIRFALFYLAEFLNTITMSAIVVTLFFGGWTLPFWGLDHPATSLGMGLAHVGVFIAKMLFFMVVFIWVRWMFPRFRYDQLMDLGWRRFLPLALVNILITAVWLWLRS